MWENHKSGSERGVKFFYKAEYCGTPQSKERRNGEYKVCLNNRALRLLDHNVTLKSECFSASERGDFSAVSRTYLRNFLLTNLTQKTIFNVQHRGDLVATIDYPL